MNKKALNHVNSDIFRRLHKNAAFSRFGKKMAFAFIKTEIRVHFPKKEEPEFPCKEKDGKMLAKCGK